MLAKKQKLIVIVEDDPGICGFLATVLHLEGYAAVEARDGARGLEEIRQRHPDLVLLDLRLPVLSGWQLLEELRGDPGIAKTNVLIITAASDPDLEERALALGVAAVLSKPIEAAKLALAIDLALGESAEPSEPG